MALSKDGSAYRRLGGGVAYEDDPTVHYSWDSNVPNSGTVAEGDLIALWDEAGLIGVSVIESIERWPDTKEVGRCPRCGGTSYEGRKTMSPTYRCYNKECGELFDHPSMKTVEVTRYRGDYAESWVDLDGLLDAPTLRSLCVSPKNQNSFRPLRIDDFRKALAAKATGDVLKLVDSTSGQVTGGHKNAVVRVRLGQGAFRAQLLADGEICAFSGPVPAAALDACHLYSYAKLGKHTDGGGLLLRKDLHHLFDRGLIRVDPQSLKLLVDPGIRDYPAYASLHGADLQLTPSTKQLGWLKLHWQQWN